MAGGCSSLRAFEMSSVPSRPFAVRPLTVGAASVVGLTFTDGAQQTTIARAYRREVWFIGGRLAVFDLEGRLNTLTNFLDILAYPYFTFKGERVERVELHLGGGDREAKYLLKQLLKAFLF